MHNLVSPNDVPVVLSAYFDQSLQNRPFPSSSQPPFQSEAKCKNQFSFKLKLELITITKISHLDSFWKRDWGELGNGLLSWSSTWDDSKDASTQICLYRPNVTKKKHRKLVKNLISGRNIYIFCPISRKALPIFIRVLQIVSITQFLISR